MAETKRTIAEYREAFLSGEMTPLDALNETRALIDENNHKSAEPMQRKHRSQISGLLRQLGLRP